MPPTRRHHLPIRAALAALAVLALALPGAALAAPKAKPTAGTLFQLKGRAGCLVDRASQPGTCAPARALQGPGPFMGSRAIALSPDGRNVYVASSESDAIAIFRRNRKTGELTQSKGAAGCIANGGGGCAAAVGLQGPNSVAVSPDGRDVYATSRGSDSVTVFLRNPKTGALTQLPGAAGCVSGLPLPGCAAGRGLGGPDVVVVSPDGRNVYVGSFFGNSVAVFDREAVSGSLAQPADASGCIAMATSGCTTAIALGSPEGMAVSPDGSAVYVAAAVSNSVAVLARNASTGALTEATNGSGCIVNAPLSGCDTGELIEGANAVATGGGSVYVSSLLSNSVTTFKPSGTPSLTQVPGPQGCVVFLVAVGCSFGRAIAAPEGVAVTPDGRSVYVAAFASSAVDVLDRAKGGAITQKGGRAGCVANGAPDCARGTALKQVSSLAVSPDGRFVYATAFGSDAVDVFRRVTH